ncbi:MAG: carbohydrate-binding family 9-like protein [Flavobacteriaceae bacterium]|nr:carbohydrate-binding family 9-like protein [Flavobacteriaceae bacterium]
MKIYFILILSLLFFGCKKDQTIKVDLSKKIIIPKHYVVTKTSDPILIDGKDNEKVWKNAKYSDDFIDIEGIKIPKQKTNVKLLWDESYLYVFAKLYENHIWGDITKRDAVIYYNNDFEIFINPNNHVFSYGEIEINALGTIWDLYLNRPYRLKGKADNSWNIKDLKSAVNINGTINDPNNIDNYWTVEMAIPLVEISQLKRPLDYDYPLPGDVWRINFSRVNWDHDLESGKYFRKKINRKYLPEYNWVWSQQGTINMHIPENWGYLIFSENNSNYIIPKEEIPKQILYALFREVSFGDLKYLKKLKHETFINFEIKEYNNRNISCNFLKTEDGFILSVFEGKIKFSINESGKIKI